MSWQVHYSYIARTRHEDEPDSVHRLDIRLPLAAVVRIPGQARRGVGLLLPLHMQSVVDHPCSKKRKKEMDHACPYAGGR